MLVAIHRLWIVVALSRYVPTSRADQSLLDRSLRRIPDQNGTDAVVVSGPPPERPVFSPTPAQEGVSSSEGGSGHLTILPDHSFSTIVLALSPPASSTLIRNTTTGSSGWNTTSSVTTLPSQPSRSSSSVPLITTITAAWPSECSEEIDEPTDSPDEVTVTLYSVTHIATVTWMGDPAGFIPPFPPISTPTECSHIPITASDWSEDTPFDASEPPSSPTPKVAHTVVFVTTDKNPAVVFPTETPPDYGGVDLDPYEHRSTDSDSSFSVPDFGMISTWAGTAKETAAPSPGVGSGPSPESVVPGAITTTIGGLEVIHSSSVATIDGTAFTIGHQATSVVVKGQLLTIGPSGIIFPSQTLPVATAGPTQVTVMGGEMITVIGPDRVVVEGTTITYGPDSTMVTKVVDGDRILIGESGIMVHGRTMGGVTAAPGATSFEIVGGATITRLDSTAMVIGSITYSLGPDMSTQVTTTIGGEIITIGPSEVAASTWTIGLPYVSTTFINAGNSAVIAAPTATESADNGGPVARPNRKLGVILPCIAIGAGFFGLRLF